MPDSVILGFPRDSRLRVILWRQIFVLVDRGDTRASDYMALAREASSVARQYPDGIGCLTILPPTASPPPEDVRRAIKEGYDYVAKYLRCACWLVEGTEFRAAAVRAALAGLRLFMRPPFPTLVTSSMEEAMPWLIGKLHTRPGPSADPLPAIAAIRRDLAAPSERPPPLDGWR